MMEKIKAGEITGQTGDYMLRATAVNGQIRAFAATSRGLVEKARQAHNTSPVATAALGRLMTAGVMMGSMMKADSDLLTIRVEGDGPIGGLTVTADKNGNVKYDSVVGTKDYLWMESEMVKILGKEDCIDRRYYDALVDAAATDISKYGDFEWFVSEDPYVSDTPPWFSPGEPHEEDSTPFDVR